MFGWPDKLVMISISNVTHYEFSAVTSRSLTTDFQARTSPLSLSVHALMIPICLNPNCSSRTERSFGFIYIYIYTFIYHLSACKYLNWISNVRYEKVLLILLTNRIAAPHILPPKKSEGH